MEFTVRGILSDMVVPTLKNLCTRLGLEKSLSRKNELVEALDRHLETNLESVLQQLTVMERNLVTEVAYSKGGYNPEVFRAKYSASVVSKPHGYYSRHDADLTRIFYRVTEAGRYVMPPTLASRTRELSAKPTPALVSAEPDIPKEVPDKRFGSRRVRIHEGAETSLIELKKVLGLAKAGKLRVAPKSKRPTKAAEKKVASVLIRPDFELEIPEEYVEESYRREETAGGVRSHGWAVLIQQCGWCNPRSEKLTLTKAGTRMLTQGRIEDFHEGVELFIEDDSFDELRRINHIRGQTGKAKRHMTLPSDRRNAIFDSMAHWPVDEWITLKEAHRFLRASGNTFKTCRNPLYLYFGDFQYGHLIDCKGVDLQYLRVFLMESLGTLGLVDIAYVFPHYLYPDFGGHWGMDDESFHGRYDGLLHVRLNQLGAYCLRLIEDYDPMPKQGKGLFRVLPNHDIVLLDHEQLSPSISDMLDSIADQASEFTWKIDRKPILMHLESGGSVEDLQEFLDSYATDGVPEQVRTFLTDLARRARACKSKEDAVIVELTDQESAAEIANDSKTSKVCRLVGTTSVVVRKRNLKAFQNALKKMGYVLPQ
ncbi:helicase-associated domain-containing protein [Thermodesulfobacteriota bacterium]